MNNGMNKANEIFTQAFDACTREYPYDHKWSNGAGSFDFAVYGQNALKLGNGEYVKTQTPSGRRIMLIGTRLGHLVVYDRFTEQQLGQSGAHKAVFSYNTTTLVMTGGWFSRNWLDEYEMALAVGDGADGNIGWRIEQLHSALKKQAA